MNKSIAQIKLELLKADGGQVPSGPSPEMLARLMQLKEQLKPGNEEFNRRQQGIINLEKVAGPVKLLTDKARGGPIHLAIGGQGPRNWMKGVEDVINPLKQTVGFMTPDRVAEQQRSIDTARRILGDNAPRATLEQMERRSNNRIVQVP